MSKRGLVRSKLKHQIHIDFLSVALGNATVYIELWTVYLIGLNLIFKSQLLWHSFSLPEWLR